jgi:hypothetical protein
VAAAFQDVQTRANPTSGGRTAAARRRRSRTPVVMSRGTLSAPYRRCLNSRCPAM